MRNGDSYDYGSVVPRFHGDEHRLQLAFLVIIEEDEVNGYPQLIVRPAKARLKKAKECLDKSDAPGFTDNFHMENDLMNIARMITDFFDNEKRMQRKSTKRCTLYRRQDDDPDNDDQNKL